MPDEDILIKVAIDVDDARKSTVKFLDEIEKQSEETGAAISENIEKSYNTVFSATDETAKKSESRWGKFFSNFKKNAGNFLKNGVSTFKKFDKTATAAFINIGKIGAASLAAATAGITLVIGAIVALASKFFSFAQQSSQATEELQKRNEENKKKFQESVQQFKNDLKPISAAVGKIAQDMIAGLNKIFEKLNESGKVEKFVIGVASTITGVASAAVQLFKNIGLEIQATILEAKAFANQIKALANLAAEFTTGLFNKERRQEAIANYNAARKQNKELIDDAKEYRGAQVNIFKTFSESSKEARKEYKQLAETLNKNPKYGQAKDGKGGPPEIEAAVGSLEYLQKILSDLNKELSQVNPSDNKRVIELTTKIRETEEAVKDLQYEYDALLGKIGVPIPEVNLQDSLKRFEEQEKKRIAKEKELAEKLRRDQARSRDVFENQIPRQGRSEFATNTFADEFGLNLEAKDLLPDTLFEETRAKLNELRTIFTNGDIGVKEFMKQFEEIKNNEGLLILQRRVSNLQETFGAASSAFGTWTQVFKEGSKEQEVAAKAQIVAQTALSISNQVLTISTLFKEAATESGKLAFPANLVVLFTMLGIIGQVLGTMKALTSSANQEFYEGGYTGRGSKRDVAGVVHKEEFVSTAKTTRKNRTLLEGLHKEDRSKIRAGIENLMLQYDLAPVKTNITVASNSNKEDYKELKRELVGLKKEMQENNRHLRKIERKNSTVENNITIKQEKRYRRG